MSVAEMSQPSLPETLAQREATARMLWTGGIVAFFVIQAVLWTVAITLTSQDPSHVVFEGYDQRALNWDSWQETVRASAALGWKTELQIGNVATVMGQRDLTLRLADRDGQAISNATVELKLFHRARAAEAETLSLQEFRPGEYVTSFRPQHAGTWKFEVTATRGADKFLDVLLLQVPAAKATSSGSSPTDSSR